MNQPFGRLHQTQQQFPGGDIVGVLGHRGLGLPPRFLLFTAVPVIVRQLAMKLAGHRRILIGLGQLLSAKPGPGIRRLHTFQAGLHPRQTGNDVVRNLLQVSFKSRLGFIFPSEHPQQIHLPPVGLGQRGLDAAGCLHQQQAEFGVGRGNTGLRRERVIPTQVHQPFAR